MINLGKKRSLLLSCLCATIMVIGYSPANQVVAQEPQYNPAEAIKKIKDAKESIQGMINDGASYAQDKVCQLQKTSSLLAGALKQKGLEMARRAIVNPGLKGLSRAMGGIDLPYNDIIMKEIRKLIPGVNECINIERGKALYASMIMMEQLSYQRRLESWEKRKAAYEARGLEFNEDPPKEPGSEEKEETSENNNMPTLSESPSEDKARPSWIGKGTGKEKMWINVNDTGEEMIDYIMADIIKRVASSITADPVYRKVIIKTLRNGVGL